MDMAVALSWNGCITVGVSYLVWGDGAEEVEKDELRELTGDPRVIAVVVCCDVIVPSYCSGI